MSLWNVHFFVSLSVSACASVAIYLLKTVATKSEFPHHHSHTFAFLLFFLISSVASSAPFGQELGCDWYRKCKALWLVQLH